jgi:hypothetical protein
VKSGAARAAVTFGLLWLLAASWSIGVPRYGAADEPSHVQKAAALVRGELTGRSAAPLPEGFRLVRIPAAFVAPDISCYVYQPDVAAACQAYPEVSGDADVATAAGRYPPAYYALVGPASLVASDYGGIWLMRLLSAAFCAALVTAGLTVLRRHPEGRTTLPVLLLALTPMAFFLFGVVSPSALEVAAAFAVWVAAVALARSQGSLDRTSVTVLAVTGVALALTRPLSPAWLALIVVAVGILAERRRRGVLLRSRPVQLTLAILAVAGVFQIAWTVLSGAISAPDPRLAVDAPFTTVARLAIGDSADQVQQLIGNFGWLDSPAPALTVVLWLVLVGAALLAAALVAGRRELVVLGSLVGVVIALPVVADIQQAAATGLVWQGRYTLPLAMGVPIVAAFVLARSPLGAVVASARARALVGGGIAVAQVAAYYWMLRRYTVGDEGGIWFWTQAAWEPPVPPLLLLAGYAAGWVALSWWLLGRGRLTLFGAAPVAIAEATSEPPPDEVVAAQHAPEATATATETVTVPG